MEISVEQVKTLRSKTGAGMMDCKKALMESNGDFNKAIEYLRKKGSVTSQKRSDRIAKEGLIIAKTSSDRKEAVITEINCETDFVARSGDFQSFANSLVDVALTNGTDKLEGLFDKKLGDDATVKQSFDSLTGKVGEKIEIKRINYYKTEGGFFSEYNHLGNKVASIVQLTGSITDKGTMLGNELAMQVVAMKPIAIDRSEISPVIIQKEKEIYITQARNEKKPENIAEKIANNKVEKFFQENCLIEQEYIKEPGKSVGDFIKAISKETGMNYEVKKIVRFQLGETLESLN
ncbi:MAG: translation elongation factor Ts [Ignavibacteria bacterium]